jgi:hypothetical protein
MASPLVRELLKTAVNKAIEDVEASRSVEHPVLRGDVAEASLGKLLKALLPSWATVGCGKIIDTTGAQSNQIDVAVYSSFVMPGILLHSDLDHQLIPVEACINTIEVKTSLTVDGLRSALSNARSIHSLQHKDDPPRTARPVTSRPSCALFAFGTDLTGTRRTEWDRYVAEDLSAFEDPLLRALCVVGSGIWIFQPGSPTRWQHTSANKDHDEVIDFLSVIANGVVPWMGRAADVMVGEYAIQPRPYVVTYKDGETQCFPEDRQRDQAK